MLLIKIILTILCIGFILFVASLPMSFYSKQLAQIMEKIAEHAIISGMLLGCILGLIFAIKEIWFMF